MLTLLLMRHAKSSWNKPGLDDHDRPLNQRGHRDAPRMGDYLAEQALIPDHILSSTALRAQTTARHVLSRFETEPELELTSDLYAAAPGQYLEVLRSVDRPCQRLLIVAHNPTTEEVIEQICGGYEVMPTAAIAVVEYRANNWSELRLDGGGRLRSVFRPREVLSPEK